MGGWRFGGSGGGGLGIDVGSRRDDECSPLRGGCEHASVAHDVEPGRGHRGGETAEKREWIEIDRGGAVSESAPEASTPNPETSDCR